MGDVWRVPHKFFCKKFFQKIVTKHRSQLFYIQRRLKTGTPKTKRI